MHFRGEGLGVRFRVRGRGLLARDESFGRQGVLEVRVLALEGEG